MEQVQRIDRKGALCEIQEHLSDIKVSNERIAEIKDALKNDWGKDEAERVVALAKLLEADTYIKTVDKINALEVLHSELLGGM